MRRSTLVLALAAAATAGLFNGQAQADDPIPVCVQKPPAYTGCTYIHTTPVPCVDGGGNIANRFRYIFFSCHL